MSTRHIWKTLGQSYHNTEDRLHQVMIRGIKATILNSILEQVAEYFVVLRLIGTGIPQPFLTDSSLVAGCRTRSARITWQMAIRYIEHTLSAKFIPTELCIDSRKAFIAFP